MTTRARLSVSVTVSSLAVCILGGCAGQTGGSPFLFPLFTPIYRSNGPANATAYNLRGMQRLQAQNTYGALEDFREAVRLEPNNSSFQEHFGWALVLSKDFDAALIALNKAVDLDPGSSEAVWKRGVARYGLKDYTGAITDYTRGLTLNPTSIGAHFHRALARASLEQWAEAEEDLTTVIAAAATPSSYAHRAQVRTRRGDFLGASLDISHAIESLPKDDGLRATRGALRFKLDDYAGALRDLDAAIDMRASEAGYYILRSQVKQRLRDDSGARQDYDTAIRLNPALLEKKL